jgi:hypothetical protein
MMIAKAMASWTPTEPRIALNPAITEYVKIIKLIIRINVNTL